MADYRVTFTYADAPRSTRELTAETVGLAIIMAAGYPGEPIRNKPTHVAVMVLHKPPRKPPEWLQCHVNQNVLNLIPGLETKGVA